MLREINEVINLLHPLEDALLIELLKQKQRTKIVLKNMEFDDDVKQYSSKRLYKVFREAVEEKLSANQWYVKARKIIEENSTCRGCKYSTIKNYGNMQFEWKDETKKVCLSCCRWTDLLSQKCEEIEDSINDIHKYIVTDDMRNTAAAIYILEKKLKHYKQTNKNETSKH